MKTFQMPKDNKRLYFENLLRIPEDVLLEQVMKRLKTHPEIRIGKRMTGPSEDLYSCRLREESFSLWFDLEDGPEIHAEDPKLIEELRQYLETE